MTSINKSLAALTTMTALVFCSCTKDFKSINTDPTGLYPNDVAVDYQNLGEPLNQAQLNIMNYVPYIYQLQQNLNGDIFSGYMMSADPFSSNPQNNTNYFMFPGWNAQTWDQAYGSVMGPIATVLQATQDPKYASFYAWAKILRVEAMHRVTDVYGPIIYTHYGVTNADGFSTYDDQQTVYTTFFNELDSSITTLTAQAAASTTGIAPFSKFDLVYAGSYKQWIKFANTLRLRLAIRISNVNATLAQKEGEKSLSDPGGLLTDATDNANVNIGSNANPITIIATSYQDINIGAPLMCFMNGYHDPRISKYAKPAGDPAVNGQYIGIRIGVPIDDQGRYGAYSLPVDFPSQMQIMTAAEAWFLKAEAAIRNWNNAGTAQTDYETGIKTSFAQYSKDPSAYVADNTSTEQPYVDPKSEVAGQNDIGTTSSNSTYLSKITIAWDENASFQTKLEKIITQKWIAMFPDGQEAWSEFRRTLYPKLFPVVVNNSGGTIVTDKFVRRLPFPSDEYSTDAGGANDGVNGAIKLLGGPDNGGIPLWWDTNPR
jgi:hypothetical protein